MVRDVDLKALVLKASKAGMTLTLCAELCGDVLLRGQRGMFYAAARISVRELDHRWMDQNELFDIAVDKIIHELNEAERKLIETGGYK